MNPGASHWFLLLGGFMCAAGALTGVLIERRRLGFIMRDQAARNSDLARRLTEAERRQSEIQTENHGLSAFLAVLPDTVRRLVSRVPRREIPLRLAASIEQVFDPQQILIYQTTSKDQLVLAHGKGLPATLDKNHTVAFGVGTIGEVAQNKFSHDRDAAQPEQSFRRGQADPADPPGLQIDLVAPMVDEGVTLGVICIGKPARRYRDDIKMMRLIADLGALALTNQDLLARFETMANRDSMTGLATKRYLNLRLGDLVNRAEKSHTPLSVVIFDIDHFKRLNDTYGHLAGDEVLKGVAAVLKGQVRLEDIPARYGGEEFVLVLPGSSKEDAIRTADKIRATIEALPLPAGIGPKGGPGVTVSGGVAALEIDGLTSHEILSAADQALYLAKEQGRNRVIAFKSRYLSDDDGEEADVVKLEIDHR